MAMTKRKMRVPSEGPFAGDPPIEVGAGTTGLVWRKHGTAPAAPLAVTNVLNAPAEIPGLAKADVFAVTLEPGYLYSIQLDSEIIQSTVTASGDFIAVWSTRSKATGTWSAWGELSPADADHQIAAVAAASIVQTMHVSDANYDAVVIDEKDAVAFGLYGATPVLLNVVGGKCFAKIEQYQL